MKLKFLMQVTCFCLIFSFSKAQNSQSQTVKVSIDTTATYQSILGWGIPLFIERQDRIGELIQDKMLDLFVNHMGCNAYRWEIYRRDWEDYQNDNENPDNIDWKFFKSDFCDKRAEQVGLPMKKMVEARGEKFITYASSSFFMEGHDGTVPEWMLQSPAELTEWLLAHLVYMKEKYGIEVDQICIVNEPDNHSRFTATNVGNAVKYLGPKLKQAGLKTTIMFPEHAMVSGALDYIEQWKEDPEVMDYISVFGYHLYFDTAYLTAEKKEILKIANSKNIPTAQTEFMGANFEILYDDLTSGGCSYWYIYLDRDYLSFNSSRTSMELKQNYWDIRQVIKYVKQGSYRTGAMTDNPQNTKVLAFKKNGQVVAVCNNSSVDKELNFEVTGLPSGSYAVNKGQKETGIQKADKSGHISVTLLPGEIATIYPTEGKNQSPLISAWKASLSYFQLPASSTTLSIVASDQENDALTYKWSVKKQPQGATVEFENENAPTTSVNGLDVQGVYAFAVTVSDKVNTVVQELVPVKVVDKNQPPVIWDLHNRHPVYVGLPGSINTTLTCVTYDPENDPVKLGWSVKSQPAGADVKLTGNETNSCGASNMSVAGDYIFQIVADDGFNQTIKDWKVTVHPANHAPEIESVSAIPPSESSAERQFTLVAHTSDEDGDNLGFWWQTRSCPPETKPVFSDQGKRTSDVNGVTVPGTYVFTFTAADNLSRISKDVTITIK